jgi:hypothetical protein
MNAYEAKLSKNKKGMQGEKNEKWSKRSFAAIFPIQILEMRSESNECYLDHIIIFVLLPSSAFPCLPPADR